jgi:diadenylate cyclase
MPEAIRAFFSSRTPLHIVRDSLDIFIVYYVVYRALLVLRGTRAMQVGAGMAILFVLYLVAQALELVTVLSIMGALISSMILIIVVVFQSDIRRGLQRVGSRAWFSFARTQESKVIDEVVEAATELARHRIGALITFEQDANLDEFVGVHKGHVIDGQVTSELLVSLFIPEGVNKLHDGSVIIRNFRIAKAGVFFPMPEGRVMDDSFGSRHRAALGITEETDAVVVIVSEERGTISFCFNGNIATSLDGPKLHAMLEAIFSPKVRKSAPRKAKPSRESVAPPPSSREREAEPAGLPPEDAPHPLVSLVADDNPPSRRLRPDSDLPPPLRPGAVSTPPPGGVSGGTLGELAKDLTKTPLPLNGETENGQKRGGS